MEKPLMLLVKIGDYGFVRQDEACLSPYLRIRAFTYGKAKGAAHLLRQLQLLGWLLRHIWGARYVLCWFADYHAFLPSLLARIWGKRLVLIIGGYDAGKLPEYGYGAHRKPFWSWVIRQNCRRAHAILSNSHFLGEELLRHIGETYRHKLIPGVLGIPDAEVFRRRTAAPPGRRVISVCGGDSLMRLRIKGMDFFQEVARACPDVHFTLVGAGGEARAWLEVQAVPNLEIVPFVAREELVALYGQAKAICLFSRYEGFGMVLLEGMLCECIPITISSLGAAEMVVAGAGYLLPGHELEAARRTIYQALEDEHLVGRHARLTAMQAFSMERRQKLLLKALGISPKEQHTAP